MKLFLKKILFYTIFCLCVMIIPSVVIDPYNVFHWENIRNYGVEPNKNYIKTKYILNNPDKFDGFLFGSSRVGSIHVEKIKDSSIYNMTYSAGTPIEHAATLRTFVENDVNVDTVIMGIDSFSYTEDPRTHNEQGLRSSYQYLQDNKDKFISMYIDPAMVLKSMDTVLDKDGMKGYDIFYEYGWWCDYDLTKEVNWNEAAPSIGVYDLMRETLDCIQEMRDLCIENNIEFIVFINPMHQITYQASVNNNDFLVFLKELAYIVPYYNFSGLNDITTNNDNYIDTSHYNAYVGDMIIEVIFNDKYYDTLFNQGFGWYVTEDNVNELIKILE